jgi:lipoprotein-anchoring transpeptidase ErfK/SrfK
LTQFVGEIPLASDRGGLAILRTALVSGVALAFLTGLASSADAQTRRMGYATNGGWYVTPAYDPVRSARFAATPKREKAEPKKDPGFGEMPKGPMQLVVSIGTQKVTLFSNGVRVAQGPISTGVPGHPTPMGVFSVIEKDRYHHSNIYSGAPMPFMQRITWSGVALHEGMLPGYPASHGCIRMSHDFAQKLWPITKLGVRVIVARQELAPVEFEHSRLFTPKLKPAEPQVAMNGATDGLSTARPIKMAQMAPTTADTGSDVKAAVPDVPAVKPAADATEDSKAAESTSQPMEPVKLIEDVKAVETVKPVEDVKAVEALETTMPVDDVKAADTAQPTEATTADDTLKATGTVEPIRPADVAVPIAPNDLRKSVEVPQSAEPPKAVEVAPAPAQPSPVEAAPGGSDTVKPAPTIDPAKPAAPRMKAADQPAKRTGQVAVFVSRKEKKIFVRQGFIPLFDMPIVIEEPDQPLGTHVFTAMAVTEGGAGMRWNLMTIPTDPSAPVVEQKDTRKKSKEPPKPTVHLKAPSTAAEALERIQMPKEAVDRIGELLIPGSSLVVSDEGLGRETGRYTDFIVLTR